MGNGKQAEVRGADGSEAPRIFTDEVVARLKIRNKARRLTEFCVACDIVRECGFGRTLAQIFERVCHPEIGHEFRRCLGCSRAAGEDCAVDQAVAHDTLRDQLGRCNLRRNFDMPLQLLRLDLMFPEAFAGEEK